MYTRKHQLPIVQADFVPPAEEISADYAEGTTTRVTLHDGSTVVLRKLAADYDPSNRHNAMAYLNEHQNKGESPTGLLFLDETGSDMHALAKTVKTPLSKLPFEELCPGNAVLQQLQKGYR
jgi:2-oxoglutarate ferredoxin oxidoreductase subunit beta